jgi:glucan 1,3-beta-glucosidase
MGDLVFMGGKIGANFGNQQFTTRNMTFHGCQTAINQLWDWGWTYKSINVYGGKVGINMSESAVGSVSLVDAVFAGVDTAILTGRNASQPIPGAGALTLENVLFKNVSHILVGVDGELVAGSEDSITQESYLFGNVYDPDGPLVMSGEDAKYNGRPHALLNAKGAYYERSKPQYEDTPSSLVLSARQFGAAGDGVTDDTYALNELFRAAAAQFDDGVLAFLDAGFYLVTDTVYVPPNVRVTGEALAAIILGSGPKFSDISNPYPVVQVGKPGEKGYVEWSDTIVSGKGATAGAVFIEYNLDTPTTNGTSDKPSGLWDVHVRVGGFTGDDLGLDKCPTYPDKENYVDENCICGYLSMHITESAYNVYLENNWLWVADHVIDDVNATRVSIFAARGMHIASTKGRIWLYGTSVEHHTLYQYSLANTRDIFMGQIQTETPYYQPNPPAPLPFTSRDESLYDPDFDADCSALARRANSTLGEADIQCRMAYGLQIHDSSSVRVVGAGIYSFFNNYQTNCSALDSGDWRCQKRIFSIGAAPEQDTYTPSAGVSATTDVVVYGLNTVGTKNMITKDGVDSADWRDNTAGFSAAIAQFRYD